jgi:hypothetical protein
VKRFLVQYEPDDTQTQSRRRNEQRRRGVKRVHRLRTVNTIEIVDAENIEAVRGLPGVRRVFEDRECLEILDDPEPQPQPVEPNDPYYFAQWSHQVARTNYAWNVTTGSDDVVVAIVDTGVDYTHPDLIGNMWVNPEDPSGPTRHGVNVIGYAPTDPRDFNGHGTHCAGIIGAVGNNEIGLVGVCHRVKLMAIQILSSQGTGSLSGAVRGFDWAIAHGANILSNSWGARVKSDDEVLELLDEVLDRTVDASVLVTFAAGNSAVNHDAYLDSKFVMADLHRPNTITVAATDIMDKAAYFTDYGVNHVHVGAPGHEIYSTYLMGLYAQMSGTSMACPYVAGVAALWMARWGKDPYICRDYILWTSTTLPDLSRMIVSGGRVDAKRMFDYACGLHPIGRTRPTGVLIETSTEVDLENIVTWIPAEGSAETIVCASPIKFPQEPGDNVIYQGTDTTCTDIVEDRLSPKFYTAWAKFPDGKYSLPVRRAHGLWEPFFCPVPPPGYDFICNFHDEIVIPYDSLFDTSMYAQLWRGLASKYRTWKWGYGYGHVPEGRAVDAPTWQDEPVFFAGYDLTEEGLPTGVFALPDTTRSEISWYLRACVKLANEFRLETTLPSEVFGRDMEYTWLDYWHYRKKDRISSWDYPNDFDAILKSAKNKNDPWFDRPQNWQRIVTLIKTIIHNCRVLYTTDIPWYFTELISHNEGWETGKAKMEDTSDAFQKMMPIDNQDEWNAPPTVWKTNPDGDAGKVLDCRVFSWYVGKEHEGFPVNVSGETVHYFYPEESGRLPYFDVHAGKFQPYGPERFNQSSVMFPAWDGTERIWFVPVAGRDYYTTRDTRLYRFNLDYQPPWHQVSVGHRDFPPPLWHEPEPPEDPEYTTVWKYRSRGPASNWRSFPKRDGWIQPHAPVGGYELNSETWHAIIKTDDPVWPNVGISNRLFENSDMRMVLPQAFDWAKRNVIFTVWLSLSAVAGVGRPLFPEPPDWATGKFMPLNDTRGTVQIDMRIFDTEYTLHVNPTEIYQEGGTREIQMHQEIIDTDGPHFFDWYMHFSLGDSVPSIVYDDLEGAENAPTIEWHSNPLSCHRRSVQGAGGWQFSPVSLLDEHGQKPIMYATLNKTLQRNQAMTAGFRIVAEDYDPDDE